jgi:hypothetical protein
MHPREKLVREAESKLRGHVLDILDDSGLTEGESLRVLAAVFGGYLASVAKYAIRVERHGDTETPGGWDGQ